MASVTTWNRIEPRARSADLADGLAARVHDPLWLLLRQWQVGEFAAHDGGSPISASVTTNVAALDRIAIGAAAAEPLDPNLPLEAVVEREVVRPAQASGDVRQAAEAGLHFARMLAGAGVASTIAASYLAAYPIARATGDAAALSGVVAGRAIDGIKLYADLAAAGTALPATPAIPQDAHDAVLAVTRSWLTWYASLFSEPPATATAWNADRFEYAFTVSASSDATGTYVANEYDGGFIDWYAFDRNSVAATTTNPSATTAASAPAAAKTAVLAPVTFRGMPARRFWEMEDAAVDLGALSAAAEDVGRLLLRDFALVYGNDWFSFPLVVPGGSVVTLASLSIADTFGTILAIPHYTAVDGAAGRWRAFAPATSAGAVYPALIVTASAGSSLDGAPIEDVMLLRDELATMVWGIERTICGASGVPIDRATQWNVSQPLVAPPSGSAVPQYRLGTSVPDYWIPFMPAAASSAGTVMLVRAKMPAATAGAQSRILTDIDAGLFLEEIPREGVHAQRLYRSARAASGVTALWLSRNRTPGSGEGRSGLEFDALVVDSAAAPSTLG